MITNALLMRVRQPYPLPKKNSDPAPPQAPRAWASRPPVSSSRRPRGCSGSTSARSPSRPTVWTSLTRSTAAASSMRTRYRHGVEGYDRDDCRILIHVVVWPCPVVMFLCEHSMLPCSTGLTHNHFRFISWPRQSILDPTSGLALSNCCLLHDHF